MSRLSVLSQMDANMEARTRSTAIVDAPCDRRFTVSAPVVHLAVSGDELTLSVVTDNESALTLAFYDLCGMEDQVGCVQRFTMLLFSVGLCLCSLSLSCVIGCVCVQMCVCVCVCVHIFLCRPQHSVNVTCVKVVFSALFSSGPCLLLIRLSCVRYMSDLICVRYA